ncbi:MAG: pilus assembly protein [Chloroflexi bacterium]|nr:pilus assembly protein [Chloroflexota bacterium]
MKSTGQAMVEFALMLPIFIIVVVGFLGMAVVFFSFVGASSAAREGVRFLAGNSYATNAEVQTTICTSNPILMSSANCLSRSQAVNNRTSCLDSYDMCIVIEPATGRIPGTLLNVTVRYHTPVPTLNVSFLNGPGFTFLGPIWVESTSVMRVEE